jgi:TfoX/Sxy family transcriptional regulator of competence genes
MTLHQQQVSFSELKMFGGLAFMVNGHMCCGIVKTDLMLKLTPDEVTAALRQAHTRPMDFSGKPMKAMLYVAPAGLDSDAALEQWIREAAAVALAEPPKAPKR